MAKMDIRGAAVTSLVAVGGGALLVNLWDMVPFLANIPIPENLWGIPVKIALLGIVALILRDQFVPGLK